MNWKLILSLSIFGAAMGLASVFGLTQRIEAWLWAAIAIACAGVIGRLAQSRPFLHGFVVGLIAGGAAPIIQTAFFDLYMRNNPDVAAEFAQSPTPVNPRLLFLLIAPVIAAGSGGVLGLLTLVAAKLVKPGHPVDAAASADVVVLKPIRRIDWWVYVVLTLGVLRLAGVLMPYALHGGPVSMVLWWIFADPSLWNWIVGVIAVVAFVWCVWRRPFWTRWRMIGLCTLGGHLLGSFALHFCAYPSSHSGSPSAVRFRLPLDGPVTVGHGGDNALVNYHVAYADQRWAYDLLVTRDGKSFKGDGKKLDNYYCYGMPVLAPAAGVVRSVMNADADQPIGKEVGFKNAGGNHLVIEVAPREFLFVCHMQPGSIQVKPGDRVVAGQLLGKVGNSGNTTEPHVHVHLQDSPEDGGGEGIPLYFHSYRVGGQFVERGMPIGGAPLGQVVEHLAREPE